MHDKLERVNSANVRPIEHQVRSKVRDLRHRHDSCNRKESAIAKNLVKNTESGAKVTGKQSSFIMSNLIMSRIRSAPVPPSTSIDESHADRYVQIIEEDEQQAPTSRGTHRFNNLRRSLNVGTKGPPPCDELAHT